jgi:hypothetical protein
MEPATHQISRPRQIAALASPARQEIVDAIEASGPCSAGELAEVLGRAQDGLYYHIRELVRVGLLVEVGRRPTARREESVYDLVGRPLELRYAPGRTRSTADVGRVVAAMLRLAHRSFAAALRGGQVRAQGPDRNIWAARAKAWLTPSDIREINEHMRAVREIARRGRREGTALHSVTFVLTPEQSAARRRENKEQSDAGTH